jgi:Flp pilus assembly protein TadG
MNPIRASKLPRRLRRPLGRRGNATIELALVLPVLVLLVAGSADLMLWMRAWFRVERVASEVATVASQYTALTTGDITALFNAGQLVAGTIDVTNGLGGQVISLASNGGSGNRIAWQRTVGGYASRIGAAGGVASLPASFTVPLGQTVLVTEAFNRRDTWVFSLKLRPDRTNRNLLYSYAVVRPRAAQLSTPPA